MSKGPSKLEMELLFQILACGLPEPEPEFQAIPGRRYRWDYAWPDKKVLVEVQGGIWVKGGHSTGTGISRDAEKNNLAVLAGYKPLIVTAEHIKSGKALAWIKSALEC